MPEPTSAPENLMRTSRRAICRLPTLRAPGRAGVVSVGSVVLMLVLAVAAMASPGPRAKARQVRVSYRAIAGRGVVSTGRFTAIFSNIHTASGRVMDESSGRTYRLPAAPACADAAPTLAGGNYLMAGCDDTIDLYHLPRGPWRTVPIAQQCLALAQEPGTGPCAAYAIGNDWIEYHIACYHCTAIREFQNIATGELRQDPATATTYANLSSSTLAAQICGPLTLPQGAEIQRDGPFVIEQTTSGVMLARCGRNTVTKLQGALAPIAARPRVLLWDQGGNGIQGRDLPSLRPVRLSNPPGLSRVLAVAVGLRKLYVLGVNRDDQQKLWRATLPKF
jgi:hypothetical protein